MSEDRIPFNKVGTGEPETLGDLAEREGITEAEWRARNLPESKLTLKWRYANKSVPLYERRLRSLREFNIGPAVQAWVRSRLEWVVDNRLHEMPDGLVVLTIDPEGMVDIQQEELTVPPRLTIQQVESGEVPGTLWVVKDGKALVAEKPRHAADTFTRDLLATLGYEVEVGLPDALDGAEAFAISDEHGIAVCEGMTGKATDKLVECFDKLWGQKQGAQIG